MLLQMPSKPVSAREQSIFRRFLLRSLRGRVQLARDERHTVRYELGVRI